jgi:hypothetical protein
MNLLAKSAPVLNTQEAVERLLAGEAVECLGDPIRKSDHGRCYYIAPDGRLWYRVRGAFEWREERGLAEITIQALRDEWPITHEWIVTDKPA